MVTPPWMNLLVRYVLTELKWVKLKSDASPGYSQCSDQQKILYIFIVDQSSDNLHFIRITLAVYVNIGNIGVVLQAVHIFLY